MIGRGTRSGMTPRENEMIATAAGLCAKSYGAEEEIRALKLCHLQTRNIYRWADNEILGFVKVRQESGKKRAYVVFRGTVSRRLGNWLFANLQMHKREFSRSCCPLEGTVHMGFFRSFHYFWYNREPELTADGVNFRKKISWMRHCFVVLGMLLVAIVVYANFSASALLLVSSLMIVAWGALYLVETEKVESFFYDKTDTDDPPMLSKLEILSRCDEVIFTGHSLGGAIATIAFAAYSEWCERKLIKANSRLITFGAPRIGDQRCIDDFESRFEGRYLHVRHRGDSVPLVPGTFRQALPHFSRGVLVPMALAVIGMFRGIYAVLYAQLPPGEWSRSGKGDTGVWEIGKGRLGLQKWHGMKVYQEELEKLSHAPLRRSENPPE